MSMRNLIERQIFAPGAFEEAFLAYIEAAELKIDNSKTIAYQVLYQKKDVSAVNNAQFFTGQIDATLTNVPASNFTRPQTEHFLIYGIRVASVAGVVTAFMTPGQSADPAMNNTVMTITNNKIVVLNQFPFSEMLDGLTTNDQGVIWLDEPILWAGQTELNIALTVKAGLSFPAAFAMQISLIGIGLV